MDYKDGTPNGGVGIWVWSMVAGWKDQTREIKPYGQTGGINREAKRERTKRKELNGKNRNWRPKQSGGVGQGLNRERSKGNKRFQKGRKATKKRCRGCFLLKYR